VIRLSRLTLELLVAMTLAVVFDPPAAFAQGKNRDPKSTHDKSATTGETAAAQPRVVVTTFEGPRAKAVRGWIVALLRDSDVELVEDKGLGKLKTDAGYAKAARKVKAAAFITGEVKQDKAWSLEISVRDGRSGSDLEKLSFKGANFNRLKAEVEGTFWVKAADLVYRARAPESALLPEEPEPKKKPKAEPEATEETEDAEENQETDEEPQAARDAALAQPRPSPLGLLVGVRGYSRRFTFHDDMFDVMRRYSLGAAPAVFLDAAWYPFAHSQGGILAHLGVMAGYEHGFATRTNDGAGGDLKTRMMAFYAGLRLRLPLGTHELAASFSYGQHGFTIVGDEQRPFPDVKYSYLRPALDATFRVDRVSFGGHVGHRFLLSSGALESDTWFPRLTGAGIDLGLFVGRVLWKTLEARAGADLRRYYFNDASGGWRPIRGGRRGRPVSVALVGTSLPNSSVGVRG
jgi:hypothetical protein